MALFCSFLIASIQLMLMISAASAAEKNSWSQRMHHDDVINFKFHPSKNLHHKWVSFKEVYGKSYSGLYEELRRKEIFAENLKRIEDHNELYKNGLSTFTMAVNQFTDLEFPEFLEQMTGYSSSSDDVTGEETVIQNPNVDLNVPKEIDWRKKGYVTAVKDQGACGSCWSFSATGALEGQNFRKTGKLVNLSEQNLVDCSSIPKYGNMGCNGGLAEKAFQYVKDNGGIDTMQSYPYEGKKGACRFKPSSVGAKCSGYIDIVPRTEQKLQATAAAVGPISVAIDVTDSFQHYKTGVYFEPKCSSSKLNHAVLLVGYGSANGPDYWIVKNSWGKSWGSDGYIYMARNQGNNCGIATSASYPTV